MKDFKTTVLGQTGLKVCRLGIGSSYGAKAKDIEWAVDHGVNYLYWGSMRREGMGEAIRSIARKDRDRIIVVVQSYSRLPFLMERSVNTALRSLGLDYADILLIGWWNNHPPQMIVERAQRLRAKGKVKFLAISTHHRPYAEQVVRKNLFDILHVRYNAAHRGAEKEVFTHIKSKSPGIVTYTTTRWGTLMRKPRSLDASIPVPDATDCYRFVLSNPKVHVCISGPANQHEMKMAVKALQKGPMDEDELKWMRQFGDVVHREAPRPSIFMMAVNLLDLSQGARD